MEKEIIRSADEIGLFCRKHFNNRNELPISSSEMGILIYINRADEVVTSNGISKFLKISKPAVSVKINNLITKGYIEKELLESDKRSYKLKLRKEGRELVESTFSSHFHTISLLKDKMGDSDFEKLIELITKANVLLNEVS